MDGFSDKLSQHFSSPQEIITANGQAEATQVEQLQNEVRSLMSTLDAKIGELQAVELQNNDQNKAAEDYAAQISSVSSKLESHIHKENVRVYRNVQASVAEELEKQTECFKGMIERLDNQQHDIREAISNMATVIEDMNDTSIKAAKGKAVLPIQIIILIIALGDLAFNVIWLLEKLGIIFF